MSFRVFKFVSEKLNNLFMPISIEHDAPELLEFYLAKQVRISEEYNRVNGMVTYLKSILNGTETKAKLPAAILTNLPMNTARQVEDLDYNPEWSWNRKIRYFLEQENSLTTSQIVKRIEEREPNRRRNLIVGGVSSILSTSIKEGKNYNRTKNDQEEYVYTLK